MRYFSFALIIALAFVATFARAQLSQTGAGSVAGGGVPNPCTGAIDLSLGCPQPMLGL